MFFNPRILGTLNILKLNLKYCLFSRYVRCIKPNSSKAPDNYDEQLVLDQLKYLGMLEIIRIRKEGFPLHMGYEDFVNRYSCLLPYPRVLMSPQDTIRAIIQTHEIPTSEWQIGRSLVFLRTIAHEPLEDSRRRVILRCVTTLQRVWRGYRVRKEYQRVRDATLQIQHAYRGWRQRLVFLRQRRAAIVIQSHLRGVFAREVAAALREMRRVEEEMRKRERIEEERRLREKEEIERRRISAEAEVREIQELEEMERYVKSLCFVLVFECFNVGRCLASSKQYHGIPGMDKGLVFFTNYFFACFYTVFFFLW